MLTYLKRFALEQGFEKLDRINAIFLDFLKESGLTRRTNRIEYLAVWVMEMIRVLGETLQIPRSLIIHRFH